MLGATTNEQTIRSWWRASPDANIGLACGNGRVVVDVDDLRALEEFEAQYGTMPPTPSQQTGKGVHFVFSGTAPRSATRCGSHQAWTSGPMVGTSWRRRPGT